MYIPSSFKIDASQTLSAFIQSHSFATLVTCNDGIPFASHLPILPTIEDGRCISLFSHMAKANPQWKHLNDQSELLVIFSGPHAYISPSWYQTQPAVPTWNYASVHVYGKPTIVEDHDRSVQLLNKMIAYFESNLDQPWSGSLPTDYRDRMIDGIVVFEVNVSRIEGKFKLGQNRSQEDIAGVYEVLAASKKPMEIELAALMASEQIFASPKRQPSES